MAERRALLRVALAALAGVPLAAFGQREGRPLKVAMLLPTDLPWERAFNDQMTKLGYAEGRNLVLARRSADGDFAQLPVLATELVRGEPDVIVSFVTQASIAAKQATSRIPVVMVAVSDPVATGLVANLARPGGNVTGTAGLSGVVVGKQFELVREILPRATRIAVLWNSANTVFQAQALHEARAAAERLQLRLIVAEVRTVGDIEPALTKAMAERPDAVVTLPDPLLASNARRIADKLIALRLPGVGSARAFADGGMLASYAPDLAEGARRAADIVHRIAQGRRPADIPVEVVGKFERLVNLRTAATLGVTVPPGVLARADEVLR